MPCAKRTVIITGASFGVGRALAVELARRGARLVLNARSEGALEQTLEACRELDAMALAVAGDASRDDVAARMAARAAELGEPGGFIHAAGVLKPGPTTWELSHEDFGEVFAASVTAAHCLLRHALPPLVEAGHGFGVFFGSGAAELTQPGIGAYCAAKAAEEHLMRQTAAELGQGPVSVFAYRPGIVDTRMQTQARESEGGAAERLQQVFRPWKEQGELIAPEEAALGLIRYLKDGPAKLHGKVVHVKDAPAL